LRVSPPNFYKCSAGGRKRGAGGITMEEDGRSHRDGGVRVAMEDKIEMLEELR